MDNNKALHPSAQAEVDRKLSIYKGMKVSELKKKLNMPDKDNKASFVQLALKMMDTSGNQFTLCEGKVNAVLKTIRLTGMKKPAETMSFMPVNFEEWANSEYWTDSSLHKYFYDKTLILFVFQQYTLGQRVDDSEITFLGAKVWKMSKYDLNHGLKEVWEEVRYLINQDKLEIIPKRQKNNKVVNKNNLPSSKFNELGHLRPGAINGEDKVVLPTGQSIVKQRFWFNKEYVEEILELKENDGKWIM